MENKKKKVSNNVKCARFYQAVSIDRKPTLCINCSDSINVILGANYITIQTPTQRIIVPLNNIAFMEMLD